MCFGNSFITYSRLKVDQVNYFQEIFTSIQDCRKIVLSLCSIENDVDFFSECGYSKNDIDRLNVEYKKILLEENEFYLDYIRNKEE